MCWNGKLRRLFDAARGKHGYGIFKLRSLRDGRDQRTSFSQSSMSTYRKCWSYFLKVSLNQSKRSIQKSQSRNLELKVLCAELISLIQTARISTVLLVQMWKQGKVINTQKTEKKKRVMTQLGWPLTCPYTLILLVNLSIKRDSESGSINVTLHKKENPILFLYMNIKVGLC